MPKRIQLKRTKGWRMPPNTVRVTRPGPWGNPFIVNPKVRPGGRSGAVFICVPTVEDAIDCYRLMVEERPGMVDEIKKYLRGKDLACFCKLDEECHADVLLELANQ